MGITYTKEQRGDIILESIGKTIIDMYYEEDGRYWVTTFDDGTETTFRFMAELV